MPVLIEIGAEDTVVINASSLEEAAAKEVPIFAGLKMRRHRSAKVIMTFLPKREMMNELVYLLKEMNINILDPSIARVVTFPVEVWTG